MTLGIASASIGLLSGIVIVGFLWLINLTVELRRLHSRGIPNPFFLILQRSIFSVLIPGPSISASSIKGRLAWLCWDVRWLDSGDTLARIIDVDPATNELTVVFDERFYGNGLKLGTVRFQPTDKLTQYGKREVSGRLLPEIQKDIFASARIVVYPEGV